MAQSDFEKAKQSYNAYSSARLNGQHILARSKLLEILPIEKNLPPYNRAVLFKSLGLICWQLGAHRESEIYYKKANQIILAYQIDNSSLQARIYNDQGLLYQQIGEYIAAHEHFENAKIVLAKVEYKGNDYYDQLSMILFNHSLVYKKREEYFGALNLLLEAKQLKEKYKLSYLGSVYFNLARCYIHIGDPKSADIYFLKSIKQWTKEYEPQHFELANIYLEYGQFLSEQGEDEKVQEYFEKAIDNYLTNYGPKHPLTASGFNLISDTHYSIDEIGEALEYVQLALISICPEFNEVDIYSNPVGMESTNDLRLLKIYTSKIKALVALANSHDYKGGQVQREYLEFAFETSEEAVKVLERIQGSYLSQESRLFLTQNQKEIFVRGIEIALQLNELTNDADYLEKAYLFAAQGKTLELSFEMREKEMLFISSLQDSGAAELTAAKESIESYSHLIQAEQIKQDPDSSRIDQWKQSRFDLRKEYESIHDKVFTGTQGKGEINMYEKNNLEDLQAKIRRKQNLVEYTISSPDEHGKGKIFAFVLGRNQFNCYQSPVDSSFYKDIEIIQTNLREYNPYTTNPEELVFLNDALSGLYKELFLPLEPWVRGGHLIIIPDDELGSIPFEALIQNPDKENKINPGINYLLYDYEISYASNASLLNNEHEARLKRPDLKVISQDYAYPVRGRLKALSSVAEETEAILNIMKGSRISSSNPKKEILSKMEEADMLHFALHVFPSDQDHSSSYMVLHQNLDQGHDSTLSHLLFDYEIDPLKLKTNLVVLNACESGSGQFHRGEGMLSLSRSFMLAGAGSVINALWPVDDKVGSSIIIQFYKNLERGNTKSSALREAKFAYLEKASPSFAHPYYWAGFQLIGNRSSLSINRSVIFVSLTGVVLLLLIVIWKRPRKCQGKRKKIIRYDQVDWK